MPRKKRKTYPAYLIGGDLDGATVQLAEMPRFLGSYTRVSYARAKATGDRNALVAIFYERIWYNAARRSHTFHFYGYQVPDGVAVIVAEAADETPPGTVGGLPT
jgi:hypothetical protein